MHFQEKLSTLYKTKFSFATRITFYEDSEGTFIYQLCFYLKFHAPIFQLFGGSTFDFGLIGFLEKNEKPKNVDLRFF